MKYEYLTLEDCFCKYRINNIACVCDADKKKILFLEE